MVTNVGGSLIEGTIGKSPIKSDMNMSAVGEISCMAGKLSGKTTHIRFMAASEQWVQHQNEHRLGSEMSDAASAPGDWRSRYERTMRQQPHEAAQLHQTVNKMPRMPDTQVAC